MQVRPATIEDIPELVRMGRLFWSQTPYSEIPYCPDSISFSCLQMIDQGLLFVATVDGKSAGAVGAMATPLYANRDVLVAAELFWWVEPEYRNLGVGNLMITVIEKAVKDAGVYRFSMTAFYDVELEKAAAVYRKRRYTPTEMTFGKIL